MTIPDPGKERTQDLSSYLPTRNCDNPRHGLGCQCKKYLKEAEEEAKTEIDDKNAEQRKKERRRGCKSW